MYFLGGTISMSSDDGAGVRPTLGADDLIAAVPGLDAADVDLTGETIAREQSGSLTPAHLLEVLQRASASDADGFVLVQGTDTLEESAYLLYSLDGVVQEALKGESSPHWSSGPP